VRERHLPVALVKGHHIRLGRQHNADDCEQDRPIAVTLPRCLRPSIVFDVITNEQTGLRSTFRQLNSVSWMTCDPSGRVQAPPAVEAAQSLTNRQSPDSDHLRPGGLV